MFNTYWLNDQSILVVSWKLATSALGFLVHSSPYFPLFLTGMFYSTNSYRAPTYFVSDTDLPHSGNRAVNKTCVTAPPRS